ncbi:putative metal-dependent ubiquitin isopeptidase [Synechococcus sp. RS9902]|nr:putative metal-dependent ubiquitin isopeptidase [Synechococcus sp. RS9902]
MRTTKSLTISAERIGATGSMPSVLQIDHRCHTDLHRILLAPHPEEGCALLLGQRTNSGCLRLTTTWPCCNVWGRGASGQQPIHDRRSRFLVDPREQLAAQRWARDRHQRCLGVAHSHPASAPVPSSRDRRLGQTESLMLILSASLGLRAWWLHGDRNVDEIPIQLWDTQNHA